jgi:hypothetical protein
VTAYNILIKVIRPGISASGSLTSEPIPASIDEARTVFDEMQTAIAKRAVAYFTLYQPVEGELPAELTVSEAFYAAPDAVVCMQIVAVHP